MSRLFIDVPHLLRGWHHGLHQLQRYLRGDNRGDLPPAGRSRNIGFPEGAAFIQNGQNKIRGPKPFQRAKQRPTGPGALDEREGV